MRTCPLCDGAPAAAETCPVHELPTIDLALLEGPPASLRLGAVIAQRYRIERPLESGAMGTLFVATQLGVQRAVAVKILRTDEPLGIPLLRRFYTEARTMGSLNHPHIAHVIDFGVDEAARVPFLVMELIEGQTLRSLIDTGPMAEGPAAHVLAQVAAALEEAHSAGIIHRDLKPENLMVTRLRNGDLHSKVIDFGIAKFLGVRQEAVTLPGVAVGTARYMSPEQARAEALDSGTDLYSLGCILYETLTGRAPFEADDTTRLMWHHLHTPAPPLPNPLAGGLPPSPELARIVGSLLEKSRQARPSSAGAVASALSRIAGASGPDPKISVKPAALSSWDQAPTLDPEGPARLALAEVGDAIGRFELKRQIGEGGFGVVYEAFDPLLRRRVAIKVMRPDVAAARSGEDPAARLERFRHEAEAVARLNHPNVVTCHEFGVHEGLPYLVMELLEGETLQALLQRGPLSPARAIDLSIEVAKALEHAHQAGVLHRDLKPSNVFLGRHVKVLDFGLARMLETIAPPPEIARGGQPYDGRELTARGAGTPAYMAPEQWDGLSGDARTDVFAAGVMLYRMVTGHLPFQVPPEGERPVFDAPPPPISSLASGAADSIARIAERAIAVSPEQRFQSAGELLDALLAVGRGRASRTDPRRGWLAAAGLLSTVLLGAGIWGLSATPSRPPAANLDRPERRSAAVLGFENVSGREADAWLAVALSDMMTAALAAGEEVRLIPTERIARAKLELGLANETGWAPESLKRIAENVGSEYAVVGAYELLGETGDMIEIRLTLENARTEQVVATSSIAGARGALVDLVRTSASRIRGHLGVLARAAPEPASVAASFPAHPAAARAYAAALVNERGLDPLGARRRLEQVVALEPDFAPGHAALARVLSTLDDGPAAVRESKLAFDLAKSMDREQRLIAEAAYYDAARERARSVEAHRALAALFPDSIDHALGLALAEEAAARTDDAYATLAALRKHASVAEDPRIDLVEAQAAGRVSDFKRMQEAATRGAARAKARGERFAEALARDLEGQALSRIGSPEAAIAALEEARRISAELGDRIGLARALTSIADKKSGLAQFKSAQSGLEEAAAIHHELGTKALESDALLSLATVRLELGDVRGAREAVDRAIALREEIEPGPAVTTARVFSGQDPGGGRGSIGRAARLRGRHEERPRREPGVRARAVRARPRDHRAACGRPRRRAVLARGRDGARAGAEAGDAGRGQPHRARGAVARPGASRGGGFAGRRGDRALREGAAPAQPDARPRGPGAGPRRRGQA